MAQATPEPGGRRGVGLSTVTRIGLGLVLAHTAFRAWALSGSWFFTDDYRLLLEAADEPLTGRYLVSPFDSQFMPFGRLVAWVVAHSGPLDWTLAAGIAVALQAAAALACLWMLTELFGRRWEVLALLALYLTSAIPLPAFMWWAAAVNQVPMQLAAFLAVGSWVRYLRAPRPRTLLLTVAAVVAGLLCYVKMLLVVPVLAFIALAYFSTGSMRSRLGGLWRSYRPAWLLGLVMSAAYVAHYLWRVPQPFEETESAPAVEVLDAMLGRSLSTGVLGGPWRWWETTPPIVLASPPEVAVRVAWVVLILVVAYSVLRRHNAGRAWALVSGYALALFALLATSRGQLFGIFAGLEYRYLTDIVVVLVLGVGLAFLELEGAPGSSRRRASPLLTVAAPRLLVAGLVTLVTLGGLLSSVRYVGYWHRDNASAAYTENLLRSLREFERPALADARLPEEVMPAYTAPFNRLSRFVRLTDEEVTFPEAARRVHLIDDSGTLRPAAVDARVDTGPGPEPDCGWRVPGGGRVRIPLGSTAFPWSWWMRLGYLSSHDMPVSITIGGSTVRTEVVHGLNDLYVQVPDAGDTVEVSGLPTGATLCIDRVQVGPLEPEEAEDR